jgi:predicted DNA binding protein
MQRVILEFRTPDLVALGVIPARFFHRYEEIELLETLRLERGFRLQLLRIRRRGPIAPAAALSRESARIRRLYGLERFELIERRPGTRDYVVLVRQRNPPMLRAILELAGGEIQPIAPFRIREDRTVAAFRGEEAAVRRVTTRLKREGIPFQVLRATAGDLRAGREAEGLTERQREVLARAWTLGFYAVPRRITLSRLAQVTQQSPPALGKMLRRAEGRIVARYLADSVPPETAE